MSLIANLEANNLAFQRAAQHVGQGEAGAIVFLKREPGTNALITLAIVSDNWAYSSVDRSGHALPPEALFELQIAEGVIAAETVKQAAAIQHGARRFRIVRPSPFEPTGLDRFWRFWLSPAEEV
jgi:hypothetical protein